MSHIAILYAPPDHAFARQLAVQLDQRGLAVWPVPDPDRAQTDGAASDPDTGRDDALDEATHVLGVLSPESVASPALLRECQRALALDRHVIAVLRETSSLPAELSACPVIDFRGPFLMAVEDLVQHLEKSGAPTHPLTIEHPPPVLKAGLLPIMLPAERCWREDRLRINYTLPIILTAQELETRLPAFLVKCDFELLDSTPKSLHARRRRAFALFDPRRADHTITVRRHHGSLEVYYQMRRTQVYHWLPAHYRVLDREAAALYRYLVTGVLDSLLLAPVQRQAHLARVMSWSALAAFVLVVCLLVYLIAI